MDYFSLKKRLQYLFTETKVREFADIDWIMVEVLGVSRSNLPMQTDISQKDVERILEIAEIRAKHIPLAQILGKAYFFGRKFEVNKDVLIPRQDTEVLVEELLPVIKLKGKASVLDIGTGSGAIAITLALETGASCLGSDISGEALEIAKSNAQKLGANVRFVRSDLFQKINEKFDFIVSNPPYIESSVIETLDEEVRCHEPRLALDGGPDGLEFYRKIIADAPQYLNEDGELWLEIGYNQAAKVKSMLSSSFECIEVIKDYGGNDRVVKAKLKD